MIQNFTNSTFNGLSKLKVLNISNNDQLPLTNETTPLLLFDSLKSLEVLIMYGTTGRCKAAPGYPGKQLVKLKLLKELWIDGHENMNFGEEFRNISSLRILYLAGDQIEPPWRSKEYCMTNIEREMLDNLVSLTHLYIRKCNVEKVEKDAFQGLRNLQYLDLSLNNQLTLEKIFEALGSLQNNTNTLVLNSIESVKPNKYTVIFTKRMALSVSHIPLRQLHLDNNRMELIEQEVFNTLPKTLQIVSLKQNDFFPGYYVFSAKFLKNLTHLDLSYQAFKNNLVLFHQSSKIESYKSEVSSTEDEEMESAKAAHIWSYDNNSYEIRKTDSDNITIETHATRGSFNRSYIMGYSGLLPTCPQLSKDSYIPPGTFISYLPPKLEHLDISVSKLAGPIFQVVLSKENSLKTLNASQSLLYCWQGPVVGLDKLQVLDLSENNCYNISPNFFSFAINLKELYLQGNILGSVFEYNYACEILKHLTSLEVINIAYNQIENMPNDFFLSQQNLVKLSAHDNAIEKFEVNIGHMTFLRVLDLSVNYISSLSETTRRELESISAKIETPTKESRLRVNLKHNPIHCYCYNIDFLKWTLEHSGKNDRLFIEVSECIFQKNLSKVTIVSPKHFEYIIDELEKECKSYVGLMAGLAIFIIIIINVAIGVIVHKHRWKIQYWYYVVFCNYSFKIRFRKNSYEEITDPFKYDVFVASPFDGSAESMSCSLEDEDFVMDKLRHVLKANNLVTFVQVYHIQSNANLIQNIGRAIHSSRVVLFVFTNDWYNDVSMKVAVHMWQCDVMNRKYKNAILGIRLGEMTDTDSEMIQDLYCCRIVDYSNDIDQKTFWKECTSEIKKLLRKSNNVENSQV